MVPHRVTRREILSLSGMTLAGLAGCTTEASDFDRQESPSPTASEPEYSHNVDSPESITVREPDGKPVVRSALHSPEENMFESSAKWDYEDWLVTSPNERDALNFSLSTTGVEAAKEFVDATDLSETTLLVHQYNIGKCETRQLTQLKWDSDFSCGDTDCVGILLDYKSTERDGDCQVTDSDDSDSPPYSEGSYASETTLIRIPAQIQSYGRFSVQV